MKKFIVLFIVLVMIAGFVITSLACLSVPIDIKPESCPNPLNVKSKGVLTVAILGTEGFDVNDIDPSTILLNGKAPLRWAIEDVATPDKPFVGKEECMECTTDGSDGYTDLVLKFDTPAVVDAIGEVDDGECFVLRLTGELFDGTLIAGEDVVLIRKKGK